MFYTNEWTKSFVIKIKILFHMTLSINWSIKYLQFAGEVMTSLNHVMISTRGNWFQTSSIEHELDNCAHLLWVIYHPATGFTNGKDIAVQLHIWSTFVMLLWLRKTEIQDRVWILVLVRVLWVMISRIYWQFWHSFFKFMFKSSSFFIPLGYRGGNGDKFVWNQCQGNHYFLHTYDVSLPQWIDWSIKWKHNFFFVKFYKHTL